MFKLSLILSVVAALFLSQGCADMQAPVEIESGLPAEQLSYYNDPFDKFRSDLWDPLGFIHQREQRMNYKAARMSFEKGQLVIRTRVGSFSKGGLGSKFELRGDFDVQVDCHIDFLQNVGDMDQSMGLAIALEGSASQANRVAALTLYKSSRKSGGISSNFHEGLDRINADGQNWSPLEKFHGTLRMVRKKVDLSLYYRRGDGQWQKSDTFSVGVGNAVVALFLQNFSLQRTFIDAPRSVTGRFDNFRINAAEDVLEQEI